MLRRKTKKKPKLNTFAYKNLLHSKSTYFYKQWSSWSNACHNIFANGFRWSSRHCEQNSGGFRLRDGANPTRSSLAFKNPYSKNAYGRLGFLKSYILPGVCVLALLLVLGLSINPISTQDNHQAFAETNIDAHSGDIVPENGVALRIDTALNDKDTIEKQVSGSGTQYIKVDFTVGANNVQNYDVYVQANSTALTGQSHGDKLQSITTDSTGTVGTKQWGYGVSRGSVEPSTMTYKPIQTNVSTSADGQDAGEGKTLTGISQPYTLAFAANLEGAASDHYKSNITLSVAVGAEETVKTWDELVYMQDMTSDICNSVIINASKTLIDIRDGKSYTIAKLKGEKCWMTQNLSTIDTTIDYKSSDMATGEFTIPASNESAFGSDTGTAQAYYNASYGAYYSWYAATAGTGTSSVINYKEAPSSICPKGWKLPSNGEFSALINGITSNETMLTSPYLFVLGGSVNSDHHKFSGNGERGAYWSRTAWDSNYGYAYGLSMSPSSGKPYMSNLYRGSGYPVRCVAR